MSDLSRFTALNVLVLGLGNIVFVPLANVFGRRIVLVVSVLVLFVATACGTRQWGVEEGPGLGMFEGTLVIRIFQGLGSSVSETVGPAVVGDMFFVGERGGWMVSFFFFSFFFGGWIVMTGAMYADNIMNRLSIPLVSPADRS